MKIEVPLIRFSLKALFVTQSVLGGVLALAVVLGVKVVIFAMALLIVLVLWSAAMARAPLATKYATVFTVMGSLVLPLIFNRLLDSRERARRTFMVENMRQVGLALHHYRLFDTSRVVDVYYRDPSWDEGPNIASEWLSPVTAQDHHE